MSMKSTNINRWLTGCLFFVLSCTQSFKKESHIRAETNSNYMDTIRDCRQWIHNGDIITRTGNDFTSENLRLLNAHDKTYSHCGIAFTENDTVFVFHAIGGDWNPDQALTKEPFDSFVNPECNRGFGIFRFSYSDNEINQLERFCKACFRIRLPFDMDFDLKTDNKMYCAEFVGKGLEIASDSQLKIPRSRIQEFEFIGVDDIYLHPDCRKIKTICYK